MKSYSLLLLLNFLIITALAQNLNLNWINHINSAGYEVVMDMKVDKSDDVIISAITSDTLILGVDTIKGNNAFIARFGSSGNYKGMMAEHPTGAWYNLALADDNSIYSWNWFDHNMVFNGDTILTASSDNLIIVKWDPAGNVQWHREILKTTYFPPYGNSSYIKEMCSDNDGNLYLLCEFKEAFVIEGDTIVPDNNWNYPFNFSYLLIKYDVNGIVNWYKPLGFENNNSYLETDDNGNVYLICSFRDSMFVNKDKIIDVNNEGIFVGKFSPNGILINHKEFLGQYIDQKFHVKLQDNKIVLVDMVYSEIRIDSLLFSDSLYSAFIFLAEMDTSLNLHKNKMIGSFFDGCFPNVAKNSYGGYHIITHNNGMLTPVIGNDTLYNVDNDHDITWIYLDSSLNYQGYKVFGGPSNDFLYNLESLSNGGVVACGNFSNYMIIDSNTYILDTINDIVLFGMDFINNIGPEINQSSIFNVYPNPASSVITILIESNKIKAGEFRIYDLNGKLMKQIPFSNNQQKLSSNIYSLSAGLYLLCLTSNNKTYYRKFIKQ